MIVYSQNLRKYNINFKNNDNTILRVNVAWVNNIKELKKLLSSVKGTIFLDYPRGRTKPPRPNISLGDTLKLLKEYTNIKYFAISNAESESTIYKLKYEIGDIELVPKIETLKGIKNLEEMVKAGSIKYIMLDKEDLYINLNKDSERFLYYINLIRYKAKELNIHILELRGVIFTDESI